MRTSSRRPLRRAAALAVLTPVTLLGLQALLALPASADVGDPYTPQPLHLAVTLGLFVGIPLLVVIVVAVLTMRPPRATGALKYRPGRAWGFDPVWFGPRPDETGETRPRVAVPGAGGASGHW